MPTQDTDDIRRLMLDWTAAIEAEDRAGILAGHDPDVLMYDFPNEVRGIEAYDRTWNFFFASRACPITFRARDIE